MQSLTTLIQLQKQSYRWLMVLLLACLGSGLLHAANKDHGALELGKAYEFDAYSSVSGYYTAQTEGMLKVSHSGGEFISVYSDEAHANEIMCDRNYDADGRIYYELPVKSGETYYFYNSFSMTKGTFTLSMIGAEAALELVSVTPENGSTFTIAGEPQVTFSFSTGIKIDNVEIVYGDNNAQKISSRVAGVNVTIFPKADIYALMKRGSIKAGDTFKLRLTNVRMAGNEAIKYGTDGICEVAYVCAAKPVEVVATSGLLAQGNSFKSFWNKGDENGILRIEFDGDLQVPESKSTEQFVQLSYGDFEAEDYYSEKLPYTVEGKVLLCDFTGKMRLPSNMLQSGKEYENIVIKITGVRGADGNFAYNENAGSLGSFSYTLKYEKVSIELITEFTPASGSSLEGVDAIEIWMTDYNKFSFDGIRFAYTDGDKQAEVVTKDYTATPDASIEGSYVLRIPVPAEVAGKKNVKLSFVNLLAADGVDYSDQLTATYNVEGQAEAFEVIPANGSKVESLAEVRLTFPGETVVSLNTDAGKLLLTKQEGQTVEMPHAELATDALNVIKLRTAAPVTEQGIYTITIPQGYVLDAAFEPMEALTLIYGVGVETGINEVVSGNAALREVYTIDGKLVPATVTNLPAGLYIVNGKKVLVK